MVMDLPISYINKAVYDYHDGNKDALWELTHSMLRYKRYSTLKDIVKKWYQSEYFKDRSGIIDQAIKAHVRGEYNLSVPVLITQIEGISGKYCENYPELKVKRFGSDGQGKLKKTIEKNEKQIFYSELIIAIIQNMLFKSNNNPTDKLNRNLVLHGNSLDHGTRENSYRCILFLDVLSELK